jgi:RimJ/RimL family protein N-acetyltransferase
MPAGTLDAIRLETERLLLRPPVPEDAHAAAVLLGDLEVMRFIGSGTVVPLEASARWSRGGACAGTTTAWARSWSSGVRTALAERFGSCLVRSDRLNETEIVDDLVIRAGGAAP